MTVSVRTPVATPIQVFATAWVGSPLAGWLLIRRTVRRFDEPARNLGSSPWLVIGWLDPVRIAMFFFFSAWALALLTLFILDPRDR